MARWEWYTPRNGKWIVTNKEAVEHMMEFRGGIDRPDLREPEGAMVCATTKLRIRCIEDEEETRQRTSQERDKATGPRHVSGSISDLFGGRE